MVDILIYSATISSVDKSNVSPNLNEHSGKTAREGGRERESGRKRAKAMSYDLKYFFHCVRSIDAFA